MIAQKKIKPFSFFLALGVCSFLLTNTVSAQQASLSLSPASGSYKTGQIFSVNILLNTGGANTDGVDVYYLHYPSGLLEVQDADVVASGVQITPGALYPSTLSNVVSSSGGTIDFSQVSSGGNFYSGSGTLATISFKVLSTGTATLSFDRIAGSTIDCNVVSSGGDILNAATGASFVLSANVPPTATASVNPTSGAAPLAVQFTGSGTDSDGTIASYSWSFGDGTANSSLQSPSHTYTSAGNFTAVLTVTDNQGGTGSNSVAVAVSSPTNQAPTATASANPGSGAAPLATQFTGSGTDPDGAIVSYSWSFGDGTANSSLQSPSHTYTMAGNFTAVLTVTDNGGGIGSKSVQVTVSGATVPTNCYQLGGVCKSNPCSTLQSCSIFAGTCSTGLYCCIGSCATPTPTPIPVVPAPTPTPTPIPTPIPSQPPTDETALIAWLKARIAELLKQIDALRAKIAALSPSSASGGRAIQYVQTAGGLIPVTFKFTRDLQFGDRNVDVEYLQIFLKMQGRVIYPEAIVSGYFGPATKAAVIRFQEKYAMEILAPSNLAKGTGSVGASTRAKINKLLGR